MFGFLEGNFERKSGAPQGGWCGSQDQRPGNQAKEPRKFGTLVVAGSVVPREKRKLWRNWCGCSSNFLLEYKRRLGWASQPSSSVRERVSNRRLAFASRSLMSKTIWCYDRARLRDQAPRSVEFGRHSLLLQIGPPGHMAATPHCCHRCMVN